MAVVSEAFNVETRLQTSSPTRPIVQPVRQEWRQHYNYPDTPRQLAVEFSQRVLPLLGQQREPAFVCIGTDRSTGDALGPLVGTFLLEGGLPDHWVWGTLNEPVHATNLSTVLSTLRQRQPNNLTVAIDACLGQANSVGMLTLGAGALHPGAGVKKELPAVGEFYLTGNVNVGGFMEYFVLQNTRLSLVMDMAQVMAQGLLRALRHG